MLSHGQIWGAIDALARRNGLSPSGLARKAGLDPTTFNKSKRSSSDGRMRWPNTESISRVLSATNTRIEDFMALTAEETGDHDFTLMQSRNIPLLGFAEAGAGGFFDDGGFPAGTGWDQVTFPDDGGRTVYALEVSGDSMMPVYRHGDIIIVSPDAGIRRGDRVVVKTQSGEVMAKILSRRTAQLIELESFNTDHVKRSVPVDEVEWIARILWASQ
ncbi:MAG: helix-turn-helix transcriptional regulator [Pseudomonadota bacterium]